MLLWIEGFDHYGVDSDVNIRTRMLNGVYADVNASCDFVGVAGRVGQGCEFNGVSELRRNLAGTTVEAGVGIGYSLNTPTLPSSASNEILLASFSDSSNADQCSFTLSATGSIKLRAISGGGTQLAESSAGVIVAAAEQHIEIYVVVANLGSYEVRVNGVTVFSGSADTQGQATAQTVQVSWGNLGGASPAWVCDDVFTWDTTGSINNNFIGDRKVYTVFPVADTVDADWIPNLGGTGYTQIDDATPDDATTYVESTVVGDTSTYDWDNLPAEVLSISGVQIYSRMLKTDAGNGSVTHTVVSDDASSPVPTDTGNTHALTVAFAYYADVFETDPATGVQFTRGGFDNSQITITRVL